MSYMDMKEILQNIDKNKHKCNGCRYKGEHLRVCIREPNLIQAEKNYNADVCPYKDMRKEDEGK